MTPFYCEACEQEARHISPATPHTCQLGCEMCKTVIELAPSLSYCPTHDYSIKPAQPIPPDRTGGEGVRDWEERFNKEFPNLWVHYPARGQILERYDRCDPSVKDFISQLLAEQSKQMADAIEMARQEGYERGAREAVDLAEKIEMEQPDGGTEQWRAFKAFRNTLRDRLNKYGNQ